MGRVYHVVNHELFNYMLRGPNGTVARDLLRRALKVEGQARRNLRKEPKRVDTGRLSTSLTHEIFMTGSFHLSRARVGTNVKYARWVHDGTGLYGPRKQLIVPKNKKALKWQTKGKGRGKNKKSSSTVFAKYSRGMKPNPFLKDALKAAKRL